MQKDEQELNHKTWLFSIIRKDFFSIPISIRIISLSMFLFVLWRGLWGDTFFSLYIKTIVNNVFRVAVIASLLPLIKMFFSVSIGALDDHSNIRSIIFVSKVIAVLMSVCFFFAGFEHSMLLLIIAVVLNGISWAALTTSYECLMRQYGKKENGSTIFGLYFSSYNAAYVVWALIAAVLVRYVSLPYLFLFIWVFASISFITDSKLPNLSRKKIKEFLGKESFLHQFLREVISLSAIRNSFAALRSTSGKIYKALGYEFIFNVLNYIWFIFIPIVAIKSNLSLSQIAVIFAIMRLPYVIDFFTGEIADKYNKKKFILIILLFLSFLYALLGFRDGFGSIIIISLGIAFGLSMLRPVISWLISYYIDPSVWGKITWIQEFTANFWAMFGALFFGVLTLFLGMSASFIIIGVWIFLIATIGIIKKFHLLPKRWNE